MAAVATASGPAAAGATAPTKAQIKTAVRQAERSKTLWATVNICDTRRYPNTIGVRGQMPALGFSSSMTLDIQVNYYSKAKKRFLPSPSPDATKAIRLGSSSDLIQQAGWTFGGWPPHTGLLNATIKFVWKRSGQVLGQTTRRTTAGHHDADFGSPPRYSAKQCRIR
jgi:hypothetical protein